METVDLLRVDFALIPDDPLFGAVITASQAITDEFYYNANVIDAEIFPPHLSLHICTIPRATLGQVTADLKALTAAGLPDIAAVMVEPSYSGYVMLNVERSPDLMALHEAILGLAARARESLGSDPFGSPYIRDSFTPHISLAKIDRDDQSEAAAIGRRTLSEPGTAPSQALDLCDIGERSERWDILASFPATENPRTSGSGTFAG
ncbi:MAG TPA: 2'-5' RNA ligase family protein [Streptosporangiaceae bacterium]|nr:2'-5' RNA ligase family protein [Streptosporangiaceae bacterium]